jgi:hypothetical protein
VEAVVRRFPEREEEEVGDDRWGRDVGERERGVRVTVRVCPGGPRPK